MLFRLRDVIAVPEAEKAGQLKADRKPSLRIISGVAGVEKIVGVPLGGETGDAGVMVPEMVMGVSICWPGISEKTHEAQMDRAFRQPAAFDENKVSFR